MYKEEQQKHKTTDADYEHLMLCLKRNELLTGAPLELALGLLEGKGDEESLLGSISAKIRTEQPLDEYECDVIIDVVLNRNYEEKRKERKSRGARYGHVKRRLSNNKPLTGKTLELALELVNVHSNDEHSSFLRNIGVKMQAGQSLDEYEYHIIVEMLMLHAKLGG